PGVMSRRQVEQVFRRELAFGAVVEAGSHGPGDHVTVVVDLARLRLGDRAYIGRPAPARLEVPPKDREAPGAAEHREPVCHERASLAVLLQVADQDLSHLLPPTAPLPVAGRARPSANA